MSYHHFTRDQRVRLQTLKRCGFSNRQCAEALGYHPSTIGRELVRGRGSTVTGYSVRRASARARTLRTAANQQHRKLYRASALSLYLCIRLAQRWSPQQIAGRLRRKYRRSVLSHQTIYRWLWRKPKAALSTLWPCLRHKKLRRRYGTKRREKTRELLKKRRIDDRPRGAADRSRYGHWEQDTIVGKARRGYIATHVERKSGYAMAAVLPRATKESFRTESEQLYGSLPPRLRRSVTSDNGREMEDHEVFTKRTGIPVYFARPYHSWERGTNENWNGLLRQFFPKDRDLAAVSQAELDRAVSLLNNRPRKRLGYRTPAEVLKDAGIAL